MPAAADHGSVDAALAAFEQAVAAGQAADADQLAAVQTQLAAVQADDTAKGKALAAALAQVAALQQQISAPLPAGWSTVTFFDDFTTAGIDPDRWTVRDGAYASNELSVDKAANAILDGQALILRAKRETARAGGGSRAYTSAYLDTIGKFSQQYGRFEVRAKLPAAKGLWPAFWLRGNTGLGELDVMESVVGVGRTVQTVHQSTNGDKAKKGHEDASVADLTGWHVYAVEREQGAVRWYIDGRLVFTVTTADAGWLDATFNEPMNIRLNLQVGGSMPAYYKTPVDDAALPADFTVDFVRVLSR